ncbi:MAG TPA: hypothetical protein VK386_04750, partial [Acidimicrobiales bacterium]|nr:hypothetical protein [Acidimicrobiales bacterium]
MGNGLNQTNPTIVSAFHSALVRQGLVVLLILAAVAVAWNVLRSIQLRRALAHDGTGGPLPVPVPEPAARRFLRIAFGLLWIFDGVLQGQVSMPLGLAPQV